MDNQIEKSVELKAPIARVWQALTDYREFGAWFGVNIEAPFVAGEVAQGHMTIPGYEHLTWRVVVKAIEPQHLFSFNWHPYAIEPDVDYSAETPTLVEFVLEPLPTRTWLTVTESGFENIPDHRRVEAFRMNEGGWAAQMENIEQYLQDAALN
ncbi:vanillate O-demethylase oxidoreductase VanB [bacterium]|nr:MAG: vanillate O-demethylase oxidoreductase VanB [bacterium]